MLTSKKQGRSQAKEEGREGRDATSIADLLNESDGLT
jgi:hypothetical protein